VIVRELIVRVQRRDPRSRRELFRQVQAWCATYHPTHLRIVRVWEPGLKVDETNPWVVETLEVSLGVVRATVANDDYLEPLVRLAKYRRNRPLDELIACVRSCDADADEWFAITP